MNEQLTIKLELPLSAVNVIMGALGNMPYVQVADLVQVIRGQAEPQIKASTPEASE